MAMTAYVIEDLKSGIFWATAIQSISAVVGLFFLINYTRYTKRMKEIQMETRRAEVDPVFTLRSLGGSATAPTTPQMMNTSSSLPRNIHIKVRNIGKGPALRFKGWHGQVDPAFRLDQSKMLTRRLGDEDGDSSSFEVLANESAEMVFQRTEISKYWLCVLECEDAGGDKHQFQLIRIPQAGAIDPWLMVHGWSAILIRPKKRKVP